jgi:hypothetical protein
MARNGGEMAEQETKPEQKKTKRKNTVRKRITKTRVPIRRALASHKTDKTLDASRKGLDTFLEAVDEELKKSGKAMAKKLIAKSKAGDVRCTKMAIDLVKDREQNRAEKKPGRAKSVAVQIALEPEWDAGLDVMKRQEGHT